jgi:hypothetical protein
MGLRGSQVDELVCPPSALSWGGLHAMLESDHGSRTLPPQNLYDLIRKTLVDVLGEDGVPIVDHEAVRMTAGRPSRNCWSVHSHGMGSDVFVENREIRSPSRRRRGAQFITSSHHRPIMRKMPADSRPIQAIRFDRHYPIALLLRYGAERLTSPFAAPYQRQDLYSRA